MEISSHSVLDRKHTGILLIDVQGKLAPLVAEAEAVVQSIGVTLQGANILDLPIVVTEQYPEGLGETIPQIKRLLPEGQEILPKTSFSACGDDRICKHLMDIPVTHWVLMGIEAHICVMQTAKDLLQVGKGVVVLNDCVSAGSVYELSTSIAEMRDCGVRVTCSEALLFELLRDSKAPEFKAISQLIKESRNALLGAL